MTVGEISSQQAKPLQSSAPETNTDKTYNDLEPGDAIFFMTRDKPSAIQKIIRAGQRLLGSKEGQENLVHVAICISKEGKDGQPGPLIAHVSETVMGYAQHNLPEFLGTQGDRPYKIFRPTEKKFRDLVVDIASDKNKIDEAKWSVQAALFAATHSSEQSETAAEQDFTMNEVLEKVVFALNL